MAFFRLVFFLFVCLFFGCGPKPETKRNATPPPTTNTPPTTGATTPPTTGAPETAPPVKQPIERVYVFKYTGGVRCYRSERSVNVSDMIWDLRNLGIVVYEKLKATDGKVYDDDSCGAKIGDINVYLIKKSDLQLSESRGNFCECTLNPGKTICVPYEYEVEPECT